MDARVPHQHRAPQPRVLRREHPSVRVVRLGVAAEQTVLDVVQRIVVPSQVVARVVVEVDSLHRRERGGEGQSGEMRVGGCGQQLALLSRAERSGQSLNHDRLNITIKHTSGS